MNILDIDNVSNYKKINSFEELYKEAKEQFISFINVENFLKNGESWEEYGFSIDYPDDQLLYKNFLQMRLSEELTEATMSNGNVEHYLEEITDAFNFFITSFVILGVDYKDLPEWKDSKFDINIMKKRIDDEKTNTYHIYKIIEKANWLCNLLKNRSWTQTSFLVSRFDFRKRLKELWEEFNNYMIYLTIDLETLFVLFAKKKAVNMFRISTNY